MTPKLSNIIILLLFLALLVQTFRLEFQPQPQPCPELQPPDTVRLPARIDTVEVPAKEDFKGTTLTDPEPTHQEPAPEPVPQVLSTYADTLDFDQVQVAYKINTLGTLQSLTIKARRTSSRVVKITDTYYITRERERLVEKKVYNSLFVGGGLGASRAAWDDLSIGALYTTKKHAYAVDYDLIDRSLNAKIYFRLF